MAQNEMRAKPALPERVRSMEGLGVEATVIRTCVFCIDVANRPIVIVRDYSGPEYGSDKPKYQRGKTLSAHEYCN